MTRRGDWLLSLAMLLLASSAEARVWTVTANPDMTFTPATLVIYQNDTVKYVNAGGLHNVHADDNYFICSLNCSTNNAPSTAAWSATVKFRHVGEHGYYCEAHGDLNGGMRGTIVVLDRVFVDGFESVSAP
ncbi:MAG TPA: plastocyanin/azurin family copper-binding protein [Rhodanobacteraceae bacterium]|nr:plastocyanin/azurin family copper-binding protein [Rhodanobacteraceae bacterium]